jgi:dynactin complex subunit
MLDKDDILLLKEIFQPQFEHLGSQLQDLKEAIGNIGIEHKTETQIRREDIKDLYAKNNEIMETVNGLENRVIKVEEKLTDIESDSKEKIESGRFSMSQWLVFAGLGLTAFIFIWDKIIAFANGNNK